MGLEYFDVEWPNVKSLCEQPMESEKFKGGVRKKFQASREVAAIEVGSLYAVGVEKEGDFCAPRQPVNVRESRIADAALLE